MGPHISFLFNRSAYDGAYPKILKTAQVLPIHKKGSKKLVKIVLKSSNMIDIGLFTVV